MTLIAEARASTARPDALMAHFCEHMAGHGLAVTGPAEARDIAFPGGIATLRLEPGAIALRIEAATADWMADAKATVAGHLEAFAPGEALGITWTGDGAEADTRPHNFRTARVVSTADLTPHMRRVTVTGPDLARFASDTAWHVKLLIPDTQDGTEPRWPRLGASGQPDFDGCSLTRRTYTIRRIAPDASSMEIDFVLHGDASPGSRFAARAKAGDWLGITGPGGGHVPAPEGHWDGVSGGWALIAGDETALPAIARALERLPAEAQGVALVEIEGPAEEQPLAHPPGVTLRWLHRGDGGPGAALLAAIRAVTWPEGASVSAWAACELETAKALREYWGTERGLARGQFRAAAYWRQGQAEGA